VWNIGLFLVEQFSARRLWKKSQENLLDLVFFLHLSLPGISGFCALARIADWVSPNGYYPASDYQQREPAARLTLAHGCSLTSRLRDSTVAGEMH
jgi:hypothetical protein